MSALTKKLELVNAALMALGNNRLSTLSVDSTDLIEALSAQELEHWIQEVLLLGPWKCVSSEASLSESVDTSDQAFAYAYALPSDFVRMIGTPTFCGGVPISASSADEGALYNIRRNDNGVQLLECDFTQPQILYVYQNLALEGYYDKIAPELRNLIITKIKLELALPVTENATLLESLEMRYMRQRKFALATLSHNGSGKVKDRGMLTGSARSL